MFRSRNSMLIGAREPNAPFPTVQQSGADLLLIFAVNPWKYKEFDEEDHGILRFIDCVRYRLGRRTTKAGTVGNADSQTWHRSGASFTASGATLACWSYQMTGSSLRIGARCRSITIFFYFRDEMFEAIARHCLVEPMSENALFRCGKSVQPTLAS